MQVVEVNLKERSYPIYVRVGSLMKIGELAKQHGLPERFAIITDENVKGFYGEMAVSSLSGAGFLVELFSMPPGESSKTLATAARLYDWLIEAGFDRRSGVVALGGGVVGDIGGFVAATYLRGLPWIAVPTTLLAQVDSSVGGKTGVDHPKGKNLIGAFHQPRFVLIDPATLRTLPKRELICGLAEAIKTALIGEKKLFSFIENKLPELLSGELNPLEEMIVASCRIKAGVVAQDEREDGLRRVLNFGHTLGHALEAATEYRHFLHGEAVAWGMMAASWISAQKGLLSASEFQRIDRVLSFLPLPSLPDLPPEEIAAYIRRDKKVLAGKLHFVLLETIGKPKITQEVTEDDLVTALRYLYERSR